MTGCMTLLIILFTNLSLHVQTAIMDTPIVESDVPLDFKADAKSKIQYGKTRESVPSSATATRRNGNLKKKLPLARLTPLVNGNPLLATDFQIPGIKTNTLRQSSIPVNDVNHLRKSSRIPRIDSYSVQRITNENSLPDKIGDVLIGKTIGVSDDTDNDNEKKARSFLFGSFPEFPDFSSGKSTDSEAVSLNGNIDVNGIHHRVSTPADVSESFNNNIPLNSENDGEETNDVIDENENDFPNDKPLLTMPTMGANTMATQNAQSEELPMPVPVEVSRIQSQPVIPVISDEKGTLLNTPLHRFTNVGEQSQLPQQQQQQQQQQSPDQQEFFAEKESSKPFLTDNADVHDVLNKDEIKSLQFNGLLPNDLNENSDISSNNNNNNNNKNSQFISPDENSIGFEEDPGEPHKGETKDARSDTKPLTNATDHGKTSQEDESAQSKSAQAAGESGSRGNITKTAGNVTDEQTTHANNNTRGNPANTTTATTTPKSSNTTTGVATKNLTNSASTSLINTTITDKNTFQIPLSSNNTNMSTTNIFGTQTGHTKSVIKTIDNSVNEHNDLLQRNKTTQHYNESMLKFVEEHVNDSPVNINNKNNNNSSTSQETSGKLISLKIPNDGIISSIKRKIQEKEEETEKKQSLKNQSGNLKMSGDEKKFGSTDEEQAVKDILYSVNDNSDNDQDSNLENNQDAAYGVNNETGVNPDGNDDIVILNGNSKYKLSSKSFDVTGSNHVNNNDELNVKISLNHVDKESVKERGILGEIDREKIPLFLNETDLHTSHRSRTSSEMVPRKVSLIVDSDNSGAKLTTEKDDVKSDVFSKDDNSDENKILQELHQRNDTEDTTKDSENDDVFFDGKSDGNASVTKSDEEGTSETLTDSKQPQQIHFQRKNKTMKVHETAFGRPPSEIKEQAENQPATEQYNVIKDTLKKNKLADNLLQKKVELLKLLNDLSSKKVNEIVNRFAEYKEKIRNISNGTTNFEDKLDNRMLQPLKNFTTASNDTKPLKNTTQTSESSSMNNENHERSTAAKSDKKDNSEISVTSLSVQNKSQDPFSEIGVGDSHGFTADTSGKVAETIGSDEMPMNGRKK